MRQTEQAKKNNEEETMFNTIQKKKPVISQSSRYAFASKWGQRVLRIADAMTSDVYGRSSVKTLRALVVVGVAGMASYVAHAQSLRLGNPGYAGSGCPASSASVTLSPDQSTLSILFDQYVTEAGPSSGKTIDRKSCNIAIPVQIPQGYSVSVFKVDYRGFTALPRASRAQFQVEYFFAGSRGPITRRTFQGPIENDYLIANELVAEALVWSPCGASTNLRANTSMFLSNSTSRDAMATVDSADVEAGLIYHLQWKRCR